MNLLVTIGYHSGEGEESLDFRAGGILLIDWAARRVLRSFRYVSPPEHATVRGRMLFHSGHLSGSQLTVTTCTEVVTFDVDRWEVSGVLSLPHFNDLHHAIWVGEDLWVCNTGLQAVHRIGPDGRVRATYDTSAARTWETYDRQTDYRRLDTKPHPVHPNHLFLMNGHVWVTRCRMRDAVMVEDHTRRLAVDVGMPHDGTPTKDLTYFTTINGYLVGADPDTGSAARVVDLNAIDPRRGQLGWCRGIQLVGEDRAFVGFTQFRPSRHKEFVHWILRDGKALLPSRIALCDLTGPRILDEMAFTGELEGAAIYSIFALPD